MLGGMLRSTVLAGLLGGKVTGMTPILGYICWATPGNGVETTAGTFLGGKVCWTTPMLGGNVAGIGPMLGGNVAGIVPMLGGNVAGIDPMLGGIFPNVLGGNVASKPPAVAGSIVGGGDRDGDITGSIVGGGVSCCPDGGQLRPSKLGSASGGKLGCGGNATIVGGICPWVTTKESDTFVPGLNDAPDGNEPCCVKETWMTSLESSVSC